MPLHKTLVNWAVRQLHPSIAMECPLPATATSYTATCPVPKQQTTNNHSKETPANHNKESPIKSLHVNFESDKDELSERKKKYLTAKYGQHQMSLIKKRLRVEMWMYEQLQALYECSETESNDIEIDLDELLDLEEKRKKEWIRSKLVDAKQPKDVVEHFIDELLERANTL